MNFGYFHFFLFVTVSVVASPTPMCNDSSAYTVANPEYFSYDWTPARECRLVGNASAESKDFVSAYLYFYVGLSDGSKGARSITIDQLTFFNVQLYVSTANALVNP
eukprot:PhF_6_TR29629/c0_g1_i1/m.43741